MTSELQSRLQLYSLNHFEQYPNLKITDFTLLAAKPESSVYGLVFQYGDGDAAQQESLVLKVFTDDINGKDRTLKERHALNQLHYRGYPVPRPIIHETEPEFVGQPFILMERAPGQPLHDLLNAVDESEQRALLTPFVRLLVDLHTMNAKALVENLMVKDELTLIKRELYQLKSLTAPVPALAAVQAWLHEHRERVPCDRPRINHRDFHPGNVLRGDDGRLTVIDWGWQIGDARADVGWLLALLEREGQSSMSAFTVAEYERLSETRLEELDYFTVMAHLRWLVELSQSLRVNRVLQNGAGAAARAALLPRMERALVRVQSVTGLVLPPAAELMELLRPH